MSSTRPGIAWLPLCIGLALLGVMTVLPNLATTSQGKADHIAAVLIFWSMSAGFVRGVGYVPDHRLPRWLLGSSACYGALALALIRLYALGRFSLPV